MKEVFYAHQGFINRIFMITYVWQSWIFSSLQCHMIICCFWYSRNISY